MNQRVKNLIFFLCTISHIAASHISKRKLSAQPINITELFQDSLFQDETLPRQQRKNLERKFVQLKSLQNINSANEQLDTPLILAAHGFETTIYGANQEDVTTMRDPVPDQWLAYIFSQNPDTNKQNNEGKTALHVAVQQLNMPLVQRLLDAGADATLRDRTNKRAIDYTDITEYDTTQQQQEKNMLKKLLKAHAQRLRKETDDAFAQLYEEEKINMPTGVVNSIASYIAPKPSQ